MRWSWLGRALDLALVIMMLAVAVNVIDGRKQPVAVQAPAWNCIPILPQPQPMVPRA